MKKRAISILIALAVACGLFTPALAAPAAGATASQRYVEAMGHGWNLGNSFDGFNSDEGAVSDETSWGNPVVTRELLQAVKAKGFGSIRMPLTLSTRYTESGGKCVIDPDWLARYKEVVDWAVDEGLYVMVNIHHDSWIWLQYWDGDTKSPEYIRFVQMWEQLAACLKDEPAQVCFETINEPKFSEGTDAEKQEKLDALNLAAYQVIRKSGGNNAERMIVLPTLDTYSGPDRCAPLLKQMQSLGDKNLIATVHYYSSWVFSANLGITGFDEVAETKDDGTEITPRDHADEAVASVREAFLDNGIGVVFGEYGILGYDANENGANQLGEELKYYEYVNALARKNGICLMFWDNGSGISRTSGRYEWRHPEVGAMLEASMKGRSSYATDLDTLYFSKRVGGDVRLPLTLNGNTFQGIDGLTQGVEYTYDSKAAAVLLKADYINGLFDKKDGYGELAGLTLRFSGGADWHQYLVKFAVPTFGDASGTAEKGLMIPAAFNGAELRRLSAYFGDGRTGPHGWWKYVQHSSHFLPNPEKGTLTLPKAFFDECADGAIRLVMDFYDGQTAELWLVKDGGTVSTRDVKLSAFRDLDPNGWYAVAVGHALASGFMRGTGASAFAPDDTLTRAQLCQIIYNMAGAPKVSGAADTPWYSAAAAWCRENGVTTEASFDPEGAVSRQEAVGFLYRYAKSQGKELKEGSLDAFSDAGKVTPGLRPAMAWAVQSGIVTGRAANTLAPDGLLTRAEMAAMAMRFCTNG